MGQAQRGRAAGNRCGVRAAGRKRHLRKTARRSLLWAPRALDWSVRWPLSSRFCLALTCCLGLLDRPPVRYVVLEHRMPDSAERPVHWDLMLEMDGRLRTWSLPAPPEPGMEMAATRLADHRLSYLEYEGEISGGRGTVRQWDAGQYWVQRESPSAMEVCFEGRRLRGPACLLQLDDAQRWTFRFVESSGG